MSDLSTETRVPEELANLLALWSALEDQADSAVPSAEADLNQRESWPQAYGNLVLSGAVSGEDMIDHVRAKMAFEYSDVFTPVASD